MVERVTFHNEENGFCVLRVKARGQRDLVTVVGHAASIAAGEWVQMSGTWFNDRTHGLQFKAAFLKASPPTTLEGIERYLSSGMIRGIGPVYAKKLVRAFGEDVFELIEQRPERLREVTGIGPKRAKRIVAGWAEQKVIREIMLFLHANSVGTSRAVRIYKTYGADAVQVISENPYRLARDIRGIGFLTADRVAEKLGIEKTAMIRIRAGLGYALAEAMDEGHCGLPADELEVVTAKLIEVPPALIQTALTLELEAGELVADTVEQQRCIFLAGLYRAEQVIAERLCALSSGRPPWPEIDVDKALPWVEARTGLTLAESQREAVRLALQSKVLVITGGPGVGKTTLVNFILKVIRAKGVEVALCAPTGRAAKRLSESTGLEGRTIQRLPPLAQRLHTDFGADARFDNPRAVQIRLPGFDLNSLSGLGRKVRDLFAEQVSHPDRIRTVVDDAYLATLAQAVTGNLGGKVGIAPRLYLRKLVADVLDRVEMFQDFDPRRDYALTVSETEMSTAERAAAGAPSVDDIDLTP